MASAPNVDGMVDIRSYAIFQDVAYNNDDCLTGAKVATNRGPFYRNFTDVVIRTMTKFNPANETTGPVTGYVLSSAPPQVNPEPFFRVEEDTFEPPATMDTSKSWVTCLCSVAVIFVVYGILFSYAVLHTQIQVEYGITTLQSILTGAASFSIFILVGPIATWFIKKIGFRPIAIFGLLLLFIGLLLEGIRTRIYLFIPSRIILLPIGGGFAYTASHYMSSFFEDGIMYAVIILACSSVLGIFAFSWFAILLQTITNYRGTCVVFALIVLLLMTVTHSFPQKLKKLRNVNSARNQLVKRCVKKGVQREILRKAKRQGFEASRNNPDSTEELKSFVCVCVCDCSTICDSGFFLWAGITMIATCTVTVPYLFVTLLHSRFITMTEVKYPLIKLLGVFCVANLIGRVCPIMYNDHTFFLNRLGFQVALTGTAIAMIFLPYLTSYGWLFIWVLVVGVCQGLLNVTIPRVTLQTVPREWLKRAWIVIIILDSTGSFIGPVFIYMMRSSEFVSGFHLPCLVIGVLQIVSVLFAFLIPNEEHNFELQTTKANDPEPEESRLTLGGAIDQDFLKGSFAYAYGGTSDGTYNHLFGSVCECVGRSASTYNCNCPVCSKLGQL